MTASVVGYMMRTALHSRRNLRGRLGLLQVKTCLSAHTAFTVIIC